MTEPDRGGWQAIHQVIADWKQRATNLRRRALESSELHDKLNCCEFLAEADLLKRCAKQLEAVLPPVGEPDPVTEPELRLCARCAHAAYVGLRCLYCGRQALAAPVGEGMTRSHEED